MTGTGSVCGSPPAPPRLSGRAVAGAIDGRYLSTEVATGFTGRVAGVRVERGVAIVRRIAITES